MIEFPEEKMKRKEKREKRMKEENRKNELSIF
jgi:hypothetical protein